MKGDDNMFPVVFVSHGTPGIAKEDNELTKKISEVGNRIIEKYGKPKAILMISSHWTTVGNCVQETEYPDQVFDVYGMPEELFKVSYSVLGNLELSKKIKEIKKLKVKVDNSWGIDHGAWSILVHMFPKKDIPVVQLSINELYNPNDCYEAGKLLKELREDYLIIGSGSVVHNLRQTDWESEKGSGECIAFDNYIKGAVENRNDEDVIAFDNNPYSKFAAPTTEHLMPLLYCLGASLEEKVETFNNVQTKNAISMTSFLIGYEE